MARVCAPLLVALSALFLSQAVAELTLNKLDREVLKDGLHRTLRTNITYTTDATADIKYCSFIFRENITRDLYIYLEEVTRDMPGFESFPLDRPMNIEQPASVAEPQDFVWRIKLRDQTPSTFLKQLKSSVADPQTFP